MDADVPQRIRVRGGREVGTASQKGGNMANGDINFEESLTKLEKLVTEMESGTLSLDEMMKRFEEGRKLVASCTTALESIRQRIEQVVSAPGEPPQVAPLDILK